jgi:hypothetical protein
MGLEDECIFAITLNLEFLSTFSSFTARPFTIKSSHSFHTVGDRTLAKETGVKTCTDRLVETSRSSVAGLSGSHNPINGTERHAGFQALPSLAQVPSASLSLLTWY